MRYILRYRAVKRLLKLAAGYHHIDLDTAKTTARKAALLLPDGSKLAYAKTLHHRNKQWIHYTYREDKI